MKRSFLRRAFFLLPLMLACFALSLAAQAQTNTKRGAQALSSVTTGNDDTALGYSALHKNITGSTNTATGSHALESNTTGGSNTANGVYALYRNSSSYENTATGVYALYGNTTGYENTATGVNTLESNTTGSSNTANGFVALQSNTTGAGNMADGFFALASNTTGSFNIALGNSAGANLTTGDNNIDIGNVGVAAESSTIRIGTQGTQTGAYIAGIYEATVAKGVEVVLDDTGHLGTKSSSERFKQDIKPMNKASEAILALKPVTFRYKKEIDPERIPQFGLVAEDVEKVNSDLVVRDKEGKPYSVRYDQVNAMLLNEFLKEHHTVEELKSTVDKQEAIIAQQQKGMEVLTAQLKEQAAQIQKVSAELKVSKPAPRTVVDND